MFFNRIVLTLDRNDDAYIELAKCTSCVLLGASMTIAININIIDGFLEII